MTLGNMRDLGVRNLRAEAERKAIVDAQEIVAIWNAERVVSQLADREPPPVAFLSWDRTAERRNGRGPRRLRRPKRSARHAGILTKPVGYGECMLSSKSSISPGGRQCVSCMSWV